MAKQLATSKSVGKMGQHDSKITLINPPPQKRIERWDMADYPHLGLGYIAAFLIARRHEVQVIDAKFERIDLEEIKRLLSLQQPGIVGITSMTHEIQRAAKVAQVTKDILPESITVIGGPHATALPEQTLIEFSSFDVAVFGEGEYTFLELVYAIKNMKSTEGIKGIAYRAANSIQKNASRDPIENLDELPFPAWELFPKAREYPVITARGCPFRCNFCMRVLGNRLRKRNPENIVNELKSLIDTYDPEVIHFIDETFTVDKKHTDKLLDLMLENGLHRRFKWDAQTRPDIGHHLFSKMKAAGCEWIGFGIESGNDEILKATGKGISLKQAANAVSEAKKAGIKTDGFFIFGHPFETPKTVKDTINFATKLNTARVTFGTMVPYPGTRIYNMAKAGEGNYRFLSQDWKDFNKNIGNSLELETLSRKQMERLQILGYLKFYLFNLRFIDGIRYLILQRRLGWAILKKVFKGFLPRKGSSKALKTIIRERFHG